MTESTRPSTAWAPEERLAAFVAACGGAVRELGRETICKCPAHDDNNPSLNVRIGDDGESLVVLCRAKCSTEGVVAAIGWKMADLMPASAAMPSRNGVHKAPRATKPKTPTTYYNTALDCANALARSRRGKLLEHYVYTRNGVPVGLVARVLPPDGKKTMPQGRCDEGRWSAFGMDKPAPLFGLDELLAAPAEVPVQIHEGEKKALLARSLGFVATSTVMGAEKAKHSDLSPLAGRVVHLFGDHDEPGRAHVADLAARAHAHGAAAVWVVTLPGLPEGGDVCDFVNERRELGASDEQIADTIRDAIAAAVEVPPPEADTQQEEEDDKGEGDEDADEPVRQNQADQLVALASEATLFHDDHGEPYASFTVGGHTETWRIGSLQFSRWLCSQFYRTYGTAVPPPVLATAISQLGAIALFDGDLVAVHVRVADSHGALWLDLSNERWQAVEITAAAWRIVDEPPVRFIRRQGMKALPRPLAGARTLDKLFDLLHVEGQDVRLLVSAWLANTVVQATSYPILAMTGEQGSGKSTFCRALQRLVDPHEIEGRSPPRNEEDLAVAAQHAHLLVYENLSAISQSLSDAFCRVATGAGFAARKLYTDADERQLTFCRPVIINGIDDLATRSDLADRVVSVHLEPIPLERRRTEAALWRAYDEMRPTLLGALLDLVVAVQQTPDQDIHLERMAEYSQLGAKVAIALGLPSEAFTSAYRSNRDHSSLTALESSAIGPVLQRMVRKDTVRCPIGSLLFELQKNASQCEQRHPDWPRHPRALGNELRRLGPNLARLGIVLHFSPRRSDGYWVTVEQIAARDVHNVHDVHQASEGGAE